MVELRSKLALASLGGGEKTLLVQTAAQVSLKAVKYSEMCPLVAIFDYSRLALFEFPVKRDTNGNARGLYHGLAADQMAAATRGGIAYEDHVSCLIFDEKEAPADMNFTSIQECSGIFTTLPSYQNL